jgi:hypothetical protein
MSLRTLASLSVAACLLAATIVNAQEREALSAARIACERELETNPSRAVALCKEATALGDKVSSTPSFLTYDQVEQTRRAY